MIHLIKILLFGIVNAAGFYAIPIMANIAVITEMYPRFSSEAGVNTFNNLFYGGGQIAWGIAAVASLGYFVAKNVELRVLLILAPIFMPVLYGVGLIIYCHFSPNL